MKLLVVFSLVYAFCTISLASETQQPVDRVADAVENYQFDLPNAKYAKYFEKTLVFGHSISSNLFVAPGSEAGLGPGTVLAEVYAGVPELANISKGTGQFSYETLMTGKMEAMMGRLGSPEEAKLFNEATAVVGYDAVYLFVIYNYCGGNTRSVIQNFVQTSFEKGKVLILGNMPNEKFEEMGLVTRMSLGFDPNNGWDSCMDEVNQILNATCTPDKNCYLVDSQKIVAQMHENGGMALRSGQGKDFYKTHELRGGPNLTKAGSQLIVEEVLSLMDKNPPQLP